MSYKKNLMICYLNIMSNESPISYIEILCMLGIAIISALSKIPFINVNNQLPFPSVIIWLCIICNIYSWFLLECWSMCYEIRELVKVKSKEELALKKNINPYIKFVLGIIILSLALISQIPNVFPAKTL